MILNEIKSLSTLRHAKYIDKFINLGMEKSKVIFVLPIHTKGALCF